MIITIGKQFYFRKQDIKRGFIAADSENVTKTATF